MITAAKIKLYSAAGAALLLIIAAGMVAFAQRDARIRAEGAHASEVKAVTARADSVITAARDSAAARAARDSVDKAALAVELQGYKDSAAALVDRSLADSARADSLLLELAAATTPADSIAKLIAAVTERGREAMNARAAEVQQRQRAERAEGTIVERDTRIAQLEKEARENLDVIADLNEKLRDPLSAPAKQGFFRKALILTEHVTLIVLAAIAITK